MDRIEAYARMAAKNVLNVQEVALLLTWTPGTVYKLTCAKQIPHYKLGKTVYFDKAEVESWMKQNRVATVDEVENEAANFNFGRADL